MSIPLSILFLLASSSGADATTAGTLARLLPRLDAAVSALSPDGRRLAIAAPPSRVLVLDLPAGDIGAQLDTGRGTPVCVAWKPDGSELCVLDHHGYVSVFDAVLGTSRLRIATASTRDTNGIGPRVVDYAAGGTVLISVLGTPAEVFGSTDGKRIARLTPADAALVTALDVSPDGETVALGDEGGHVTMWRTRTGVATGQSVAVPCGDEQVGVHALDFHPDGKRLAIGGGDCTARVWSFDSGARMLELPSCEDDIFGGRATDSLEFSPDGSCLATTTFSWRLTRIWSSTSGKLIGSYDYSGGNPTRTSTRFTSDGRYVVAGIGGIVLDARDGTLARRLEKTWPDWVRYESRGALAWAWYSCKFRVFDVVTGAVILDRATE